MQCKENQTLMCERDNLMRSVTELVPLREPSMVLQLGTLLADTAETFNMKYMEWKEGPRGVPEDGRCVPYVRRPRKLLKRGPRSPLRSISMLQTQKRR